MLEVRVLHIAMLSKLLDIYLSLSNSSFPAIIGQGDAVAKAFDRALEHFIIDLLNFQLLLELADKIFFIRRKESIDATGANVLLLFTHVSPTNITRKMRYDLILSARLTYCLFGTYIILLIN